MPDERKRRLNDRTEKGATGAVGTVATSTMFKATTETKRGEKRGGMMQRMVLTVLILALVGNLLPAALAQSEGELVPSCDVEASRIFWAQHCPPL